KRDAMLEPMARAAMGSSPPGRSNAGRIVRTRALGRAECGVPIRHVQALALRRSGPRTPDRGMLPRLCFRECAALHEVLSCRECSPNRPRFLLREPQARDF